MKHEGFICEICTWFVGEEKPLRVKLHDKTAVWICQKCRDAVRNAEEIDWLSESLDKDVL